MSVNNNNSICPFCKKHNQCQANTDVTCWCNQVKIPNELIDLLAENDKGKVCICSACIDSYHRDPDAFIANIDNR